VVMMPLRNPEAKKEARRAWLEMIVQAPLDQAPTGFAAELSGCLETAEPRCTHNENLFRMLGVPPGPHGESEVSFRSRPARWRTPGTRFALSGYIPGDYPAGYRGGPVCARCGVSGSPHTEQAG